jgi:hypothetical protein
MEKTLELIGSVQPGQKFYVRNGMLEIERNPRHFATIARRWYTSTNRTKTIGLIEKIVHDAVNERIVPVEQINVVRSGLENLQKTYQSDPKTVAHLNKILGFIDYNVKTDALDRYIWRSLSGPSTPISFPPLPSCAITVSTGAKGQILSTSSSATSEQFRVGSLPKSSRTL